MGRLFLIQYDQTPHTKLFLCRTCHTHIVLVPNLVLVVTNLSLSLSLSLSPLCVCWFFFSFSYQRKSVTLILLGFLGYSYTCIQRKVVANIQIDFKLFLRLYIYTYFFENLIVLGMFFEDTYDLGYF
jgi:hypothetical protein